MDDLVQIAGYILGVILIGAYTLFGEVMRRRSKRRDAKTTEQGRRITELENQLGTVSTNAESAEKLALKQANEIQNLKQQLADEQNTRERVVAELQAKNKSLESELTTMKLQLAESRSSYNEVNEKFVNLAVRRDELVQKVDQMSNALRQTHEELTTERGKTAAYHEVMVTFSQQLKFVTENKMTTAEVEAVKSSEESA